MKAFDYDQLPQRVVFGAGRRTEIVGEVRRLGRRVFLVADGAAGAVGDELAGLLGDLVAMRWSEVVQHVPMELAERAVEAVRRSGADVVVCVGGGSSTGLAKAIALDCDLPIVAVPTTYAGSEQTTIYGISGDRHKRVGKDPTVLPRTVIYDAELTIGLPGHVTGPSAFNALAHSVEALYAPGHNPVTSALALESVRAINLSLPAVTAEPTNVDHRGTLLYGAYLAGMALGATAAAFHHKICHVLGGTFNLVHADAHSVILPHAIAFTGAVLPDEMTRLAESLGAPGTDPAGALWDLAAASKVPTSLAGLRNQATGESLRRSDLAEAAQRAAGEITSNPRPFTEADLLALLERAFDGARPE